MEFQLFDIADIGDSYVEKVAARIAAKGFEVENCFKEHKQERFPIGRNSVAVERKEFFSIEFSNDAGEFGTILVVKSSFHGIKGNPYDGKAVAAVSKWGGYNVQATNETKAVLGWKEPQKG